MINHKNSFLYFSTNTKVISRGSAAYQPENSKTINVRAELVYPAHFPTDVSSTFAAENIPIVYTIKNDALGKLIRGRKSQENTQLALRMIIKSGGQP